MFKLREPEQSLKWPVKVSVPRDGGGVNEYEFTGHFRVLLQQELEQVQHNDEKLINAVLVGWEKNLCDENDEPVPFDEKARARLAAIPYVKLAIIAAYWELSAGRASKN